MIDTHCHLLPAVDDGPPDLAGSLALAAQLRGDGVETIVCTPHFSRRYPTEHEQAAQVLAELRLELERRGIDLTLHLAAEISPAFAVSEPLPALRRRVLGTRYCLVELLPDTPAMFLESARERLAGGALLPVFGHPERCRAVQQRPRVLDAPRGAGALVQVVASSLTGRWGADVERTGWLLLESGRVDLLASDAHRAHEQGSQLGAALTLVERRLGAAVVEQLTRIGPASVLGSPEAGGGGAPIP